MIWEFRLEDAVVSYVTWEELEPDLHRMLQEFNRKVLRDIKTSKESVEWQRSSKEP